MKRQKSILVIDDEDSICLAFRLFFEPRGWSVHAAASAADGLADFLELRPTVVFLDIRLPDRSGMELLEELAANSADVVMITAYGGLDTVVRAIQGKAYDYLVKPLDLDKALALADRICDVRSVATDDEGSLKPSRNILVGISPAMQEVYKFIARASGAASPVMIQGQTGTGKELVARAIHNFSARHAGPFVAINCGAIPENLIESELFGHVRGAFTGAEGDRAGKFESADGGTLLLDEVGELPPAAQVKLLRVLDSGTVERVGSSRQIQLDVRIVAATNRQLADEVAAGRFRQDLFYRLAVFQVTLPPLRDRKEDIVPLAEHFLACAAQEGQPPATLSKQAIEALTARDWPGNVRELRNTLEHALAVAPDRIIRAEDLPQTPPSAADTDLSAQEHLAQSAVEYIKLMPPDDKEKHRNLLDIIDHAVIAYAMERCNGNQSDAADFLGLHRNTLRKKLRELGIEMPQ